MSEADARELRAGRELAEEVVVFLAVYDDPTANANHVDVHADDLRRVVDAFYAARGAVQP